MKFFLAELKALAGYYSECRHGAIDCNCTERARDVLSMIAGFEELHRSETPVRNDKETAPEVRP